MKYLILLVLFIGCSSQKITSEVETVTFQNDSNSELKIKDQTISDLKIDTQTSVEKAEQKEPSISMSIYSSFYSSLALVELLKRLEKSETKVKSFSVNGLAAVIVSLYGIDESTNTLEWKLFKLLKGLKGLTPYKADWRKKVLEFCQNEFKNKKFSDLKFKVQIPTNDAAGRGFISEGLLTKAIEENLQIESNKNYFKKPAIFKRDLVNDVSDIHFNLSFIPQNIQFKLVDGYSWGIFTNYFGFILKNEAEINTIKTDADINIDELLPLGDITTTYNKSIEDFVETIQNEVNTWKEEFTASSN